MGSIGIIKNICVKKIIFKCNLSYKFHIVMIDEPFLKKTKTFLTKTNPKKLNILIYLWSMSDWILLIHTNKIYCLALFNTKTKKMSMDSQFGKKRRRGLLWQQVIIVYQMIDIIVFSLPGWLKTIQYDMHFWITSYDL